MAYVLGSSFNFESAKFLVIRLMEIRCTIRNQCLRSLVVDTAFVEQKSCPINGIRIHFKTILPVV